MPSSGASLGVAMLIPVLRRPQNVAPLLASIAGNTPLPWRVVFICDPDDHEEMQAIDNRPIEPSGNIERVTVAGNYARKINTAFWLTDEPIVFFGADDLRFHPGWLEAGLKPFNDPKIGVVGTNDLGSPRVMAGEHATHFLVRREYVADCGTIDEPNKALHEGYHHNFCDDEFVGTAKRREAWISAPDCHVEHLHPHWGKGDEDGTYKIGQSRFARDRQLNIRRRKLWRAR